MQMCQHHWNELIRLIEENGLSSFIAKDGYKAVKNLKMQFEGKETIPDPLMMSNMMIMERSISTFGIGIMSEGCPICFSNNIENYPARNGEPTGEYWVRTLIPHIKKMFEEKGLLNKN